MNEEEQRELAALNALGVLDGADLRAFQELLASSSPSLEKDLAAFKKLAELLGRSISRTKEPSPELKTRLLSKVQELSSGKQPEEKKVSAQPDLPAGFRFVRKDDPLGWRELPVQGASVKVLSTDTVSGYAFVLGKLEPGTRYPAHRHFHAEDVFVLTGDLHIGDFVLKAGDFHHADAGTRHAVNYSEEGCTILAVISVDDLTAQFA